MQIAEAPLNPDAAARMEELVARMRQAVYKRTDRMFVSLLVFQWIGGMALAAWVSPRTWEGHLSATHPHVWAAVFLGGAIISLPLYLGLVWPGRTLTRHIIATAQMLSGALLIHLTGGRIETHFHVFGSLAFLSFYRDWRVLISGSAVVAVDHLLRGFLWPESVYGVAGGAEWRWVEHAAWVAFIDFFLIYKCAIGNQEWRTIAQRQVDLEVTLNNVEKMVGDRTAALQQSESKARAALESLEKQKAELEGLNRSLLLANGAIEESEKKFRHTINAAPDAIIGIDEHGKVLEFNRAAEKTFGYTRSEMIGASLVAIIPERLVARHQDGLEHFRTTGQRRLPHWRDLEMPGRTKDGREILLAISLSLLEDDGKSYLTGVLRDITDRKQAEEAARQVHVENERLLNSIPSILIGLDVGNRITKWNKAAENAFTIPAAGAVGKELKDLNIAWDAHRLTQHLGECQNADHPTQLEDVSFRHLDGKLGFLSIALTPVPGLEGTKGGVLLLGSDVSERRYLETQLAQAQKLESVGQLAAGVAHEINTPIQYVGDNITFLKEAFGDLRLTLGAYDRVLAAARLGKVNGELLNEVEELSAKADVAYLNTEIPKAIGQSLEGVQHVAKIVRAMKEFSHPDGENMVPIDINRAIDTTITVARNEWRYVAEVVTDFAADLPLVPCFPGEFNQVILNLLVNAAHAIAERNGTSGTNGKSNGAPGHSNGNEGTITVTTRGHGDRVEIRIADTGTGIPEAIRARIFDPFFTTKPIGKGTGQGLAISHAVVVKKHHGSISFETEDGKGTTFIIALPKQSERRNS